MLRRLLTLFCIIAIPLNVLASESAQKYVVIIDSSDCLKYFAESNLIERSSPIVSSGCKIIEISDAFIPLQEQGSNHMPSQLCDLYPLDVINGLEYLFGVDETVRNSYFTSCYFVISGIFPPFLRICLQEETDYFVIPQSENLGSYVIYEADEFLNLFTQSIYQEYISTDLFKIEAIHYPNAVMIPVSEIVLNNGGIYMWDTYERIAYFSIGANSIIINYNNSLLYEPNNNNHVNYLRNNLYGKTYTWVDDEGVLWMDYNNAVVFIKAILEFE